MQRHRQRHRQSSRLTGKNTMKNLTVLPLILIGCSILLFTACQSERLSKNCGGKKPVEELTWLREIVQADTYQQYGWMKRFRFEGETYFISGSCCPFCNWVPEYYACDGTLVDFSGDQAQEVQAAWEDGSTSEYVFCGDDCDCRE